MIGYTCNSLSWIGHPFCWCISDNASYEAICIYVYVLISYVLAIACTKTIATYKHDVFVANLDAITFWCLISMLRKFCYSTIKTHFWQSYCKHSYVIQIIIYSSHNFALYHFKWTVNMKLICSYVSCLGLKYIARLINSRKGDAIFASWNKN